MGVLREAGSPCGPATLACDVFLTKAAVDAALDSSILDILKRLFCVPPGMGVFLSLSLFFAMYYPLF